MDLLTTQTITTAINVIMAAIGGFLVRQTAVITPVAFKLLDAKLGDANLNKIVTYGTLAFHKIEEDGRLGTLVDTKINTFANILTAKFPEVTPAEIDLVRQSIAGEYNKDNLLGRLAAPIKMALTTVQTIEPTTVYKTADGIELVPKTTVLEASQSCAITPDTNATSGVATGTSV